MEEVHTRRIDAILINEPRRHKAREQRPLIRVGQSLHQRIQPDLVHQRLRDRAAEHAPPTRNVVEQVRALELGLEVIERGGKLVGDRRTRLRPTKPRVLAEDTVELGCSILGDLGLDVLDVALVKLRGLLLKGHKVDVLLRRERKTRKDLEGGRSDTALVGARVLEQNDLALLEEETGLLREEEVRAFDDVLEVRLALGIDERGDVGDVDGLGTAAAGNEDVRLEAEVGTVAEIGSVDNELASCKWTLVFPRKA